jgi:hypothetical protein
MPESSAEDLCIFLTPEQALTILAALRQYEPYWPANEEPARIAERLRNLRMDIASVTAKIQAAAAATL